MGIRGSGQQSEIRPLPRQLVPPFIRLEGRANNELFSTVERAFSDVGVSLRLAEFRGLLHHEAIPG